MDWPHPLCSKVMAGGRVEAVVAFPSLSTAPVKVVAGAVHVPQLQYSPAT